MKKTVIAASIVINSVVFYSCMKDNVQPVYDASLVTNKSSLNQPIFNMDPNVNTSIADRATLGQADGNPQ
jgi:hypothetical protein